MEVGRTVEGVVGTGGCEGNKSAGPAINIPGKFGYPGGFWETGCLDSRGSCLGAATVEAQNLPHFGPSYTFCSVPWGWMVEAESSESPGSIFYPIFSNPVLFKAPEVIIVARKTAS